MMNCKDAQSLMHAYADKELELLKNFEMEEHLQSCPACERMLADALALRSALEAETPYHKANIALQNRIHAALQKEDQKETREKDKTTQKPRALNWAWLNAGAALAFAIVLTWTIVPLLSNRSADDMIVQEIVSSHVRSLLASHLTDVASSDQHTVKPWFSGKLDFSPPVDNFVEQGFPLIGGRLDYLENKTVAALIYQHRKHYINLFVWPADVDAATTPKELSHQGYQIIHWTQSGMHFWAVSELNHDELKQFTALVQHPS